MDTTPIADLPQKICSGINLGHIGGYETGDFGEEAGCGLNGTLENMLILEDSAS